MPEKQQISHRICNI